MFYLHLNYEWVPRFDALVTKMKSLPIWQQMIDTIEDSPWHREANVAVHTEMVVDQAAVFAPLYELSERNAKLLFLACFFHDFGKPESEEICTKEDGTLYRRYPGHEMVSARLFEQIFVSQYKELFEGWVTPEEAHAVTFLIEHHLPYKVTDKRKRIQYGWAMQEMFGGPETLYAMLRSDTWGRISDEQPAKKQAVMEWCFAFQEMFDAEIEDVFMGYNVQKYVRLVLLVGPSGAGKSTVAKELIDLGFEYYSWDALRVEFYQKYVEAHNKSVMECDAEIVGADEVSDHLIELPTDEKELYHAAFKHWSSDAHDSEFKQLQAQRFQELVNRGASIVVDNTNLTRKRRRGMLEMARQKKYRTKAIYFQASLDMLFRRAQTRTDKRLPLDVVQHQFNSVQVPFVGEFYEVAVVNPFVSSEPTGTNLGYGLLPTY